MKPHPTRRCSSAVVGGPARPARSWEVGAGGRCGCSARSGSIGHCGLLVVQEPDERSLGVDTRLVLAGYGVDRRTATRARQWARWALERSTLATGDADANPPAGDEALSARATTWPGAASAAERALDRGAASKLTLVSAPAGFGKSRLLAEWLAGTSATGGERSAAWLSLDSGDNDPVTFWSYVIAALRTVAPGIGAQRAGAAAASPQPPPIEVVLTTLLNDLGATGSDIVLVLDDYHLIDSREIQDAMAFLLDHLPPRLHLVIASRADPALLAGAAASTRRAGRGPCRRPAVHAGRGCGVPQRGDGPAADGRGRGGAGGTHRRAGSPRCSWRRCRCRDATTSPGSSPASRGTTATSSTTWSRRSCSASPSQVRDFLLHTSVLDRLNGAAVRRRHRTGWRQGHARDPRSRQPVPGRRSTTGVSGTATTTCSQTC